MRNLLYFLPVVLFAGFAGTAYWGMQRDNADELPSVVVGKQVPAIRLEPMSGTTPFAASDLANGQVSFVNFWASWCGPCRSEHPNLMALADRGVPVFGVNYRDDPANAQAFLDQLGDPYAMGGGDPNGQMALDWGVYGVPETFVIGPDGTVILRVAGVLTQRNIESRVLPALTEAGLKLPNP